MKKLLLFIFHIYLGLNGALIAQVNWEQIIEISGNVNWLASDSSGGNLFAGTRDGSGIYLLTDNGSNWTSHLTRKTYCFLHLYLI